MKVINHSNTWEPKGSWRRVDPYTTAFVYNLSGKELLYKGGLAHISFIIEQEIKEPYIVHYTMWHKGKSRTIVKAENFPFSVYFMKSGIDNPYRKRIVAYNDDHETLFEKEVKRFPRCFPVELKTLLGEYVN